MGRHGLHQLTMPWGPERRNAYHRRLYRKRRRIALRMLAAVQGQDCPACIDCGWEEDLEVDHRDPEAKRFDPFGSRWKAPWSEWIDEVLKCELRCSSCHLERTVREGHHVPPGRQQAARELRSRGRA